MKRICIEKHLLELQCISMLSIYKIDTFKNSHKLDIRGEIDCLKKGLNLHVFEMGSLW